MSPVLVAAGRLAALVALVMAAGCTKTPAAQAPPQPSAVTVARPVQHKVMEWDEYTGRLEAVQSVDVRARVSGLIVSVPFEEGALVRQGDLLVEIDERPFQAVLDSRLADEARAAAQVDLARIEFNRVSGVPDGARTPTELDTAAASLREAQAALAASRAAVEAARLDVEWCRVKAPITGRVSSRYVTSGNLITGGVGTGTLLTTITSVDPIYGYIDVDERSLLKYQRLAREGKRLSGRDGRIPCALQLANETGFPHEGVIDFVDNRIDPGTGTIRMRGAFANPDGSLMPGLFARVRVPGAGPYDALLVPDASVATDLNGKVLFVVDASDTVQRRPVQLGPLFGPLRVVDSGITPDDRVVTNGQMRIRPGAKVAPHDEPIAVSSLPPVPDGATPEASRVRSENTAQPTGLGGPADAAAARLLSPVVPVAPSISPAPARARSAP